MHCSSCSGCYFPEALSRVEIRSHLLNFGAVPMLTVSLLVVSNVFMTLAWYGHLKFRGAPLWIAILASWGIAMFEYIFQVPANRWGAGRFSVTQLKIMQECIT